MTCDLPEFYDWNEPVAGKRHRCCECAAPILKGEKHFHAWGKWDGRMESYRQHMACCQACMLIRDKFSDGECIPFGWLMEYFREFTGGQYSRQSEHDKNNPAWRSLRELMAKILWRQRSYRRLLKAGG